MPSPIAWDQPSAFGFPVRGAINALIPNSIFSDAAAIMVAPHPHDQNATPLASVPAPSTEDLLRSFELSSGLAVRYALHAITPTVVDEDTDLRIRSMTASDGARHASDAVNSTFVQHR
jgi:hypothetical protein